MAEFSTKCPHCNTELVAEEDWIGMKGECPSCQQSFTVAKEAPKIPKLSIPQIKPITPTATANDENTETSFTFVCPECGTQVELPIVLKGKKYECKACCEESIAEPATEKKCPHCGKMIKFHATICKFCKKNVDVSANASINLQPISPIGNQPINLQPIQNNNGVNLQPINPTQNTPYNSAPVTEELIYLSPTKSKATAIVLNVLFGGIGHVYIGQVAKGFTLFGAITIILIFARHGIPILGIPFWLLYIFSIVDIVKLYKKLEQGKGIKNWDSFFSK